MSKMGYYSSSSVSGKCDPEVEQALRTHDNIITSVQQAIESLKSQQTTSGTTSASSTTTTSSTSTSTSTITEVASTVLGYANDLTGQTSYATLQADYGKILILDSAAAVAVSLTTGGITLPWYADFLNLGAGAATLTPSTGVISYAGHLGAASMPITQGYFATVVFDGTNFWAELSPIVPVTTAAIAHEWLASYDATTGLFTQTQPAFTDISGIAAPSQLPTPTTSTIGGVEAIAQVASNWINSIDTSGVPHLSQPAFSDISGVATPAQLPIATASALGAVEPDGTTITITSGGKITAASGSGTVTAVSVATANGFEGTSSGGTTPALTLNVDSTHVLPVNTGSATEYLNESGAYSIPAGSGTTTDALTAAATGGADPGATFNGSAAVTIDYHTVGADAAGAADTAQSNAETFATNASGSNTINATEVNGAAIPASATLVGTNSSKQIVVQTGTISNDTTGNAATATNATEVGGKSITGSGAAIVTGPSSSVSGDLVGFTGTAGQIADSGIAASNVPLLNAANAFTSAGTTSFAGNISITGTGPNGGPATLSIINNSTSNPDWGSSVFAPNLTSGESIVSPFVGVGSGTNQSGYMRFNYVGSGSTANNLSWGFYDNNDLVTLKATGNLGIGTTSPEARLEVDSTGSVSTVILRNTGGDVGTYTELLFAPFTGTTAATASIRNVYQQTNDSNLTFLTTNSSSAPTEKMRVTQTGNVGIGTTTPNSKLAVVGLPIYTSNSAATTGGLTTGDFYRDGSDPDHVCVVH